MQKKTLIEKLKQVIYDSFHNSTISDILLSLIVGSYVIIDDIFIPQSPENTIRKIILMAILCTIILLRLILSIKSGSICFKKKQTKIKTTLKDNSSASDESVTNTEDSMTEDSSAS